MLLSILVEAGKTHTAEASNRRRHWFANTDYLLLGVLIGLIDGLPLGLGLHIGSSIGPTDGLVYGLQDGLSFGITGLLLSLVSAYREPLTVIAYLLSNAISHCLCSLLPHLLPVESGARNCLIDTTS